jgi:hypothetical protein
VYCIKRDNKILKIAHHCLPVSVITGRESITLNQNSVTIEQKEFVNLSGARRGQVFGSVIKKMKVVTLKPSKYGVNN